MWQYGPLVEAGWATEREFVPHARRTETFLIATEGSSDVHILKHALALLCRPGEPAVEPAVDLAAEKFGFSTQGGYPGRYSDTPFAVKFSDPSSQSLSSFIYDVYVYDDDGDVFVEIKCADEALLAEAVATFDVITPLTRHDVLARMSASHRLAVTRSIG